MKIPDTIKILGYTYKIEKVKDRTFTHGTNNVGSCSCVHQKIWIDTNASKEQQESTLIHEVLEAINYHLRLKLGDEVICPLESAIYQVLKDNQII